MEILNGIHYKAQGYTTKSVCACYRTISQHVVRTNQSSEGIRYSAVLPERIRRLRRNTRTIGQHRLF